MTEAPLACVDFVEIVTEYLEGTMSVKERRRFEEHLAACPGCTAYLKQIRETIRAVGSVTEEDLSAPARADERLAPGDRRARRSLLADPPDDRGARDGDGE